MPDIYVVCGPTASGKSSAAMALAAENNGLIINCDLLQIYDALPILTAQPSADDKANIPHALYASRHPNEVCSAGNWREDVMPIITQAFENGQTPIICGGTGLYIKALMEGLSPIPDIPDEDRQRVVAQYDALGGDAFYEELERRDPIMAARLHPNHKARLIRAMEVIESTGKSLAEWQNIPPDGPPSDWNFIVQKIMPERETLYHNCNARFENMIENGALDEVKSLQIDIKENRVHANAPITKALGFKDLSRYLDGNLDLSEAITLSQGATRRYAKRQVTWFRNQI